MLRRVCLREQEVSRERESVDENYCQAALEEDERRRLAMKEGIAMKLTIGTASKLLLYAL